MRKIEDYRRHAAECRDMATRATTPEQREMLVNMADTWDSLAEGRAAQLKRLERLERLGDGKMAVGSENPQTDD